MCSNSDEGESRFEDDGWVTEEDLVFNSNSIANIICECTKVINHSTHSVFFGDVVEVKHNNSHKALLYTSGGYLVD